MLGIKGRGEGEKRGQRGKNLVSCVPLGKGKKAEVRDSEQRSSVQLWDPCGDIGARVPARGGLGGDGLCEERKGSGSGAGIPSCWERGSGRFASLLSSCAPSAELSPTGQ